MFPCCQIFYVGSLSQDKMDGIRGEPALSHTDGVVNLETKANLA